MANIKQQEFRLFYIQPPISQIKKPQVHEFREKDFESAYIESKEFIKTKAPKTQILMLAQTTR